MMFTVFFHRPGTNNFCHGNNPTLLDVGLRALSTQYGHILALGIYSLVKTMQQVIVENNIFIRNH